MSFGIRSGWSDGRNGSRKTESDGEETLQTVRELVNDARAPAALETLLKKKKLLF